MADTKLTGLSALSGVITPDDLLYVVQDPGGTPASAKATAAQVVTEFLLHDSTVSMATATVDVSLPSSVFDDYESIRVRASGFVPDTPTEAPAFFGYQVFPTGGSPSTIDLIGALELTGTPGCILWLNLLLAGAAATGFVGPERAYMASDTPDGPTNADSDPQVDDWSAGITIRLLFTDNVSDPVDTTAGRVIVWGRKKP